MLEMWCCQLGMRAVELVVWNTISRVSVTKTVSDPGHFRLIMDRVFTIAVFNRANITYYLETDSGECAYG